MYGSRPTIAEVNLEAIRSNFREIRKVVPADTAIMAVIKADAYGHGFMDVSKELDLLDVDVFSVASLAEAVQLRSCGIDRPILILGGIYPGQELNCILHNISTTVFSVEQLLALDRVAGEKYMTAAVHLKIDTGMGRVGMPHDMALELLVQIKKLRHICLEGLMSHFACADEAGESALNYTGEQADRFLHVVDMAKRMCLYPRYIHISNSSGSVTMNYPFCNAVRIGIALYGAQLNEYTDIKLSLRPAMKLISRIAFLKWVEPGSSISYGRRFTADTRTLIASVPIGYADGYPRSLSNKAEAVVRGSRARVTGSVCMDWLMLDVTQITDVKLGDEVLLMGDDGNGNVITAEELAAKAGTITYEIYCGISKRVPRAYVGSS
jgi:alanine racemase